MTTTNFLNPIETTQPLKLPLPTLPKVKAFDMDMLPKAIQAFVIDVADRQQSPPDFVGVTAMCGLAAVLGRKARMRPKQLDDWTATANQWGILIGKPSTMKSPSMKEALRPLILIENIASEEYEKCNKRYLAEKELSDLEKANIKSKAKKASAGGNRDEALSLLEHAEFSEKAPTRKRLIVNDPSVEKLGELLNENPNGLILVRDELAGWLLKIIKEEYQPERAFYLETFDGNGRYTYDRIGRGTIEIKNCTLSIIGGIQPSKIRPLLREAIRGTSDDGLVQRFQLAVWPDDTGSWIWKDRAPNKIAREEYFDAFNLIHHLSFPTINDEPQYFHFTNEAQELFIRWVESIQTLAHTDGICPAFESHLLKMPRTIATLALVIELVDGGREAVGKTATLKALKWAEYLTSHAERIYSITQNQGLENAHLILKRKDKLPSSFTCRDVQRKGWTGLDTTETVNEALEYLVDYKYLEPIQTDSNNQVGRSTIRFYWN